MSFEGITMYDRLCKITFIRHGATIYTEENRLSDDKKYPPLNENGREEMKNTALWIKNRGLKVDKIYCSDTSRSIQSAQILCEYLKQDFEIDEALSPKKAGVLNGLSYLQIEKKYPEELEKYHNDRSNYGFEGGESLSELNKRISKEITNIINKNLYKRVFIITDADLIQAAVAQALNIPTNYQTRIHIPTASASQISYFKSWQILMYSSFVPYM